MLGVERIFLIQAQLIIFSETDASHDSKKEQTMEQKSKSLENPFNKFMSLQCDPGEPDIYVFHTFVWRLEHRNCTRQTSRKWSETGALGFKSLTIVTPSVVFDIGNVENLFCLLPS